MCVVYCCRDYSTHFLVCIVLWGSGKAQVNEQEMNMNSILRVEVWGCPASQVR